MSEYIMCSDCPVRHTSFSVVVNEEMQVQRFECDRCGSTNVEPLPEADFA